jgi:seryl-tRNA synthetase
MSSATEPSAEDAYLAFRTELVDAALLYPLGSEGLYARSGVFEEIVEALGRRVTAAGADLEATVLRFPPLIPRWVFERTDYLRSFPDLTGSIHTFVGDDALHAELLRRADSGEDWTSVLVPADVMLCSAACHPLYPLCTGVLPPGGRSYDVYGYCFRHEPAVDPARMQAFRQREYVFVGEPDGARAHRDRWLERAQDLLADVGLEVEAVVANDPFFGRAGRMLASNQREEALKWELVTPVATAARPTAIVSCNCHLDHFGVPFGIQTPDGEAAHSACVGFGVERITLALLRRHGLDPLEWPAAVRTSLWP